MLDRASLRTLAQHPERNDPMLNVALAEEGDTEVLVALAECPSVGPETLAKIAWRVQHEGESVGHQPDPEPEDTVRRGSRRADDEPAPFTFGTELDVRLVVHPHADDAVRDTVLARHPDDAFFALAAAAHSHASVAALERVARWPAATPLHDRTWLPLISARAIPPKLLEDWTSDADPLAREAAARLTHDPLCLERLASDASRRVRRAVASNPFPSKLRAHLAENDAACEVRARAAAPLEPQRDEGDASPLRGIDVSSARFKTAVEAMHAGGRVSSDVSRAMRAGPLDREGARLAARALDEASLSSLVASRSLADEIGLALAAGIALRDDMSAQNGTADDALLLQCVHALAGADRRGGFVTGKGRLAHWLAEGVSTMLLDSPDEVVAALGRGSLASDRMVLARATAGTRPRHEDLVPLLVERSRAIGAPVPIGLIELAWRDQRVSNENIMALVGRVPTTSKLDASPEQEVDLDPSGRPLAVLERVGSVLVGRAPLSPRAALALVALEPRRVRYVLSAMPQWRGVLSGANVIRVLRAHAGALSAAGPSAGRRPSSSPAAWTQRKLDEVELAVALAIGDIDPSTAASRISSGQDVLLSGTALAAGMEARAALEGTKALEPLVLFLARGRSQDAAALAAWLVIETLDRARSAAAIAAALDAPWSVGTHGPTRTGASSAPPRSMVAPGVAEALASLERRSPGRLAEVAPQTPRGRAALVSGLARAYRALGGMSVNDVGSSS